MASGGNSMGAFDPFGWFEKWIPARYLHLLIRLGVIIILILFLIHRIIQDKDFLVKPLWVVETLIFVAFLVSYIIRMDPVERSRMSRNRCPLNRWGLAFFFAPDAAESMDHRQHL